MQLTNNLYIKLERKTVKETNNNNGTPPPAAVRTQALKESKSLKNLEKEKAKNAYNSGKNGNGKPKT
jgi:hypothetical protein